MGLNRFLYTLLIVTCVHLFTSCKQNGNKETRDDFKEFYDQYNVDGTFVLYDQNNDKYLVYNEEQSKTLYTPSSTFKIFNSLIGIETGVIKDQDFVIAWDSIKRDNPGWNKDHNLKTAFSNSVVWYYQELARRVGGTQMKYWLDKTGYGNADTTGGIDQFWLRGGLRISPEQQITFLKNLHDNKLPFSQRTMDIVKGIMISEDTLGYVLRSKTGWGMQDNKDIGWHVGYLENNNNVYYFANCISVSDLNGTEFARARVDVSYAIFNKLKILGK